MMLWLMQHFDSVCSSQLVWSRVEAAIAAHIKPVSTHADRDERRAAKRARQAAVHAFAVEFDLGPSRVGPQTSRPLGASF